MTEILLLLLSQFSMYPHLDTTGLLCWVPSTRCRSQWLLLELVSSARAENQSPAFCHFSMIRNKVLVICACDTHHITNPSKMFIIILESSPLLALKKNILQGKHLKYYQQQPYTLQSANVKEMERESHSWGKYATEKNEYRKTEEFACFQRNLSVYYLTTLPPMFALIFNIRGEWLTPIFTTVY